MKVNYLMEKPYELTYSVIFAKKGTKFLMVRHRDRTTWEFPGGHIEAGESESEAAVRELKEETGAIEFQIGFIGYYSVETDETEGFGALFIADIEKIGEIQDRSEIAEVKTFDTLPENLTYPEIIASLYQNFKKLNSIKESV